MHLMLCSETELTDFVFIDSGTGGIPYLTYLKELSPSSSCAYVADTLNFPYGQKTHEEIVSSVISLCKIIKEKLQPKVIVIACNTMSVNTLDVVREALPEIHFVGTVPAIKVAGEISKKRRIGLLATKSTCEHPYNQDLKNHFASDCELILRPDPDLISFIEHKSFNASEEDCVNACRPCIDYFNEKDCDVIILGCTHFLNIKDIIQKTAGDKIKVVDSKEGVVKRALQLGGVTGDSPVGKGSEQQSASEGKAGMRSIFPSLYITGFSDKKDEKVYNIICSRFNLEFKGVI